MASFTENIPVMTSFRPNVSQMPLVEAMSIVGREKQAKYDEGLQKIQSQIDSVAGMDIVRDVDKQYLNTKLNELTGKLRPIAAGDFSNYQLVNSVGGAINKIGKDPNVQNAVGSTARYRKEVSLMDTAVKEGKSSPANVYRFQKEANNWLSSHDLSASFSGAYIPYFDVDKFTKETFDSIKPDGYTIDQIYETDGNGVPLKDKSGQLILSPVMSRLKKEGKFPEKVQQTINHIFSDPRVGQQLQISGEYQYRNYTPELLQQSLTVVKAQQLKKYDDQISELNIKAAKGEDVQSKIDKINSDKLKITNQYDQLLAAAVSNPDVIRGMIYSDSVRDTYQSMYTNITEERTQHSNPGWDAQFRMMQEANRMAIHRAEMEEKQKDRINNRLIAQGKGKPGEEDIQNDPTFGAISSQTDYNEMFDKQYERAASNSISAINAFLASTAFKDKVNSARDVDSYITSQVRGEVEAEYQKAGGKNSGLDYNELLQDKVSKYRQSWYTQAIVELNENPNKLSTTTQMLKVSAEKAISNFDEYQSKKTIYDSGLTPVIKQTLDNIQPLKLTKGMGFSKDVILSKQDQLDLSIIYGAPTFGNKDVEKLKKEANERLKNKGTGRIIEELASNPNTRVMYNYWKDKMKNLYNPEIQKSLEDRAKMIEERSMINPVATETTLPKDKQKDLSGIIGKYIEEGKNYSSGFMDNAANIQKALETDKVTFKMDVITDEITGEQTPIIHLFSEGTDLGEVTITPQEANSLGYKIQNWTKDNQIKAVENKILSTNRFQTSYGDIDDVITYRQNDALSGASYFPQMQGSKVDVKGNIKHYELFENGGIIDMYVPYIYMNNGEIELISDKLGEFDSVEKALIAMKSVNPMLVNGLLTQNKNQ